MSEERKRRCTLILRPSRRSGALGSSSRRRFSLGGGSKVLDKSAFQIQKQPVQVFDEEHNDVTPQPLYQVDPTAAEAKTSRFLLDEISAGSTWDQITTTGSFIMPFSRSVFGSSRISSHSTIESLNEEMEETFSKRDMMSFLLPDEKASKTSVKETVTEDMLMETVDVFITESDSVPLLDIPSSSASADADVAEAIIERNNQYAEVCENRIDNDKYVDRSVQTLNGLTKNKQIQRTGLVMVDTATTVSTSDMFDDLVQEDTVDSPRARKTGSDEAVIDSSTSAERSVSFVSSGSTGFSAAGASSSLKEVDAFGKMLNTQSDLQLITMSEKFQYSLLVMERSVLRNSFHPQLAAYRQLPLLEDPDKLLKMEEEEQGKRDTPPRRALRCLWVYSCELSIGCRVSSMAWNTKNPDLLAVGYGELDSRNQKPGLVCCWSLKNPMWPDCIIHCDSAVTSLDFSTSSPSQLAVGMCDGNVAIYNVQSADFKSCAISSCESPNGHIGPVWQLKWNQQELNFTGEKLETLFSVGADGRVKKWFIFNGGLDCTDSMKLKRIHHTNRKDGVKKTTESVLSALTPALCFDFHPTESSVYLTGTWEGLIHKCSCSNSQQFLETYKQHFCPVNRVAWCPLSPDMFLSCSSDWTIQLWRQDRLTPVLGLTSAHGAVCDIKWSPRRAAVFGAVNEGQLEIWDLNSSFLNPVIVQPAAPGVKMSSLLFASHTDCVAVGDANGQVTVYELEDLSVGENSQVDVLEGLLSEERLPRQFGTAHEES